MATPINLSSPATQSAYQPQPSRTSGALVLNINAPLSNYAGDGPMPGPSAQGQGANEGIMSPAGDSFQKINNASAPSSGGSVSSSASNGFGSPEQQLQDAYNNALDIRNKAEQARNAYLNLGNQLNGQAFQTKLSDSPSPQPFGLPQSPTATPDANPGAQQQQYQQQLQSLQQAQQMQQMQQQIKQQAQQLQQAQQAAQQAQQMQQQQLQQMQMAALQQQQQPQQQPQMPGANPYDPMGQQQMGQQQQFDPSQQMQQQQPQGLMAASIADLNNIMKQGSPKDTLDAINEIAMRQQGDRETYEILKQRAANTMPNLPPDDANLVREAALFALGNLLGSPINAGVPTSELPGMTDIVSKIAKNPTEPPPVRSSAITAAGIVLANRPQDPFIVNLLRKAGKDRNPDVKTAVDRLLQPQAQGPAGNMPDMQQQQAMQMFQPQMMPQQPGSPQMY